MSFPSVTFFLYLHLCLKFKSPGAIALFYSLNIRIRSGYIGNLTLFVVGFCAFFSCSLFPYRTITCAHLQLIPHLFPKTGSSLQDSLSPGTLQILITVSKSDGAFPQAPTVFEQQEGVDERWSCAICWKLSCHVALGQGSAQKSRDWDQGPLALILAQPPPVGWQLQLLLFPGVWLLRCLSLGCKALS